MEDNEWSQTVAEAMYIARFQAKCLSSEIKTLLISTGLLVKKEN